MISRNSIRSGTEFLLSYDENPIWWHLGRIVQIKNARVWETEDRVGIVHIWRFIKRKLDLIITGWIHWWRRSIEQIFTNQDFWGQKRKLWKERRGQESGDKTAWTKNSWRLLAVESQRAVFWRRQLQFSSRYQLSMQNRHSRILLRNSSTRQKEKCIENPKSLW